MRILLASLPFDGHLLPTTGVARHLLDQGHEVRFYTGASYADRLARAGIPHEPFRTAVELTAETLPDHLPDLDRLKGPKRISLQAEKIFFGQVGAHFDDVAAIHAEWPFDAFVYDAALYAAWLVKHRLGVPTYAIFNTLSPAPVSKGNPPPFFGLRPARNPLSRLQQRVIRAMVDSTNKRGLATLAHALEVRGAPPYDGSIWDLPWAAATTVFASGLPALHFPDQEFPANNVFVGAVRPPAVTRVELPHRERLEAAGSVVVVTQGTVDNHDPEKLIAPTLTAFAGTEHTVVATLGRGSDVAGMRRRFPQANLIIEEYVDFDTLFPHADAFVGNAGFGGVLTAAVNGVPMVLAGKTEDKADIGARVALRGYGIDLRKERPGPEEIRRAVDRVLTDPSYRNNVGRLATELAACTPMETITKVVTGS